MKLRQAYKVLYGGRHYRASTWDRASKRANRATLTSRRREDREDGISPPWHERFRQPPIEEALAIGLGLKA